MPVQLTNAPWLSIRAYLGGSAFTLDDPDLGVLDAGNVLGPTDDGWHDLTASTMRAGWRIGATSADGPTGRISPAFGTIDVLDLDRTYDPSNERSGFRHRFGPNTPVKVDAWFYSDGTPTPATHYRAAPPRIQTRAGVLPEAWRTLYASDFSDGSLDGLTVTGDPVVSDGVLTFPTGTGRAMVDAGIEGTASTLLSAGVGNLRTVICQNDDRTAELYVQWVPQFATWNAYRRTGGTLTTLGNTGTSSAAHWVHLAYDPDTSTFTVTRSLPSTGQTWVREYDVGPFPDAGRWAGVESAEAAGTAAGWTDLTVEGWDTPLPTPQLAGRIESCQWVEGVTTLTVTDGLADLAAYDAAESPQMPAEYPADRLARVLVDAGYRGDTNLDPGTVELAAGTYAASALSYAYLIADSELGALYVDRAGVLRLRDRSVWNHPPAPSVTITPDDWTGVLSTTRSALSAERVRNVIGAAGKDMSEVVVSDPASVQKWSTRRYSRRDLLVASALQLDPWVKSVLRWTADVRPGAVERLTLWPIGRPELWPAVTGLDVGEVWTLTGADTQDLMVVGWAHDVTPNDWRVILTTTAPPTGPAPPAVGEPVGGTIVDADGYRHHLFHTSNAADGFTCDTDLDVDVLTIGGGGCGGDGDAGNTHRGGGGGGGGWREVFGLALAPGTYTVTVGEGGERVTLRDGRPSQFAAYANTLAAGGGGGTDVGTSVGRPGASGAGGAAYASGGGFSAGGAATPAGQGHPGISGGSFYGGGGGGQSATGSNANGGSGRISTISPVEQTPGIPYAYGRGGNGASNASTVPYTPTEGSGRGGGGGNAAQPAGAPGGSGTVVVRYPYPFAK